MREAIILAGGFGTRLRSVIDELPKPMAPINGKPFLEILLGYLARQGFTRTILSLGYRAEMIINHFGASFAGIEVLYEVESTPLGTGGAIKVALKHCRGDAAYVLNGDTFLEFNANGMEKCWVEHGEPILSARMVDDTERYETLDISGDQLKGFRPRGLSEMGLINAGCYLLPVSLGERMHRKMPFSFELDFLSSDVLNNPYRVVPVEGDFIDIGIPEDYARAQVLLNRYLN